MRYPIGVTTHAHQRHRPPRLERVFSDLRSFYFVTFNTHKRRLLLADERIHSCFCNFAIQAKEHGVAVGRYVLMPDHAHLFIVLPETGPTLSRWMQSLRSVLGKQLLILGEPKPHWQEGFFDHLMRSGESYGEKWNYVRMNPVRAGLVKNPADWPYQGEIQEIRF
jgi:putative transposase